MHSAVQRHQSPERPILCQISSVMYPTIQRRQVFMNVLHPGCVRPPRWSPPILWRGFEDCLASVCNSAFLSIRARCPKKVRRLDLMMDESGGWLVKRRMLAFLTKSCQRMSKILRRHHLHCINPLCIHLVNCPAIWSQ